jgi:hypothetical protein
MPNLTWNLEILDLGNGTLSLTLMRVGLAEDADFSSRIKS